MRGPLILLLVALALAAVPSASRARGLDTREGWVVGMAYGPALAKIRGADSLTTDWLEGPAQSIRVGRMFGPQWKLGYEHQAWLREQGFEGMKIRAGVQLEALAVTAFLGRPGTVRGAFYVIAGGGWAHCRMTLLEPLEPGESAIGDTYETVFLEDEYGWGGFGGLGWEYQITRSFSAGLATTYNYVDIGGDIYDHAKFMPLAASLNWNF